MEVHLATVSLIHYDHASPAVQAIFDDIKATRSLPDVNNFWKALANQPELLRRTWETVREVMQAGAIDAVTKEMIYIAISIANNCEYCIHSHTASATGKGMTREQYAELLAVVALASQTNALATGMQVPVDDRYLPTQG
jgi:AhpD family alkylhydroperoxidase